MSGNGFQAQITPGRARKTNVMTKTRHCENLAPGSRENRGVSVYSGKDIFIFHFESQIRRLISVSPALDNSQLAQVSTETRGTATPAPLKGSEGRLTCVVARFFMYFF